MRTAKSCGPDAPTLASSFADFSAQRRWQESPVTGESTKETVKTIACGNAGCSGVLVVTTLVCYQHTAHEAAGAAAPGIPHALRAKGFFKARAQRAARSGTHVEQRHCEERSDEAIHLSLRGYVDCFAPLAMTSQPAWTTAVPRVQ